MHFHAVSENPNRVDYWEEADLILSIGGTSESINRDLLINDSGAGYSELGYAFERGDSDSDHLTML